MRRSRRRCLLKAGDVPGSHPGAELRGVAEKVQQANDPPPMGSVRLQQFEHFLVGSSISAAEVMGDQVFDVEVTYRHLVGITVGDGQGGGGGPQSDPVEAKQSPFGHSRIGGSQTVDRVCSLREAPEHFRLPLLQVQFVKGVIGCLGHLQGVRRETETFVGARSRLRKRPIEPPDGRRGLMSGHLLATYGDDQGIEDQAGAANAKPWMAPMELGYERVVRLESLGIIAQPGHSPEACEEPPGSDTPRLADQLIRGPPDAE